MDVPRIAGSLTRIAHLSDLHMLDSCSARGGASHSLRVRFLSAGRKLDVRGRIANLQRALGLARTHAATHVVISGDLTESGTPKEFETLAEALNLSGWRPERVTLVPGNHDAYTSSTAWREALQGPLRAYRHTSAEHAGKVIDFGDVAILPLDVACHQAITRSSGELTYDAAEAVRRRVADRAFAQKTTIIVQHHPPFAHASKAWQWVDGLQGWSRLCGILERVSNLSLLHGHLHHAVDKLIGHCGSRSYGAPALVEGVRIRMYEVQQGLLESQGLIEA